jgi:hypothetical protein
LTTPLPDEDLSEIALCAIKFPNSMKLLLDPNVWFADIGATVHATPNSSALIKKSERNGNDSVTMGNGKSEATEWYGDLPVTICHMEGNTTGDSKMTHVAYVPTSKFNLFSLMVVTTIGEKKATRHEYFYGKNPKWRKFLRMWGEAGTVKVKTKTTPKLADRGVHCMFIGYTDDDDGDVYRM